MAPQQLSVPSLGDDLVVSGEVHYWRLDPDQWEDRLDKAVGMGVTGIATYIPWLVHELPDGTFDFGEKHPHLNLERYLRLCEERGLAVIARPGPFVMAELKNEGLGYSVLRAHPEIRVPGWDGERKPETMIDYLHPDYLAAARRWYDAVIPVVAKHLPSSGGTVVGVQLDNEIGMLPWVTNSPDLSDATVADLVTRLVEREGAAEVRARYAVGGSAFDVDDAATWGPALRSPNEEQALALHRDVGRFTRDRYARYVSTLADWAHELGIGQDVPLLVNVHGCWGGRATMFPLGISQLYKTWEGRPNVIPGSDFYIGDLTLDKLPGFWASNAFLAATCADGQPYGSLEFEAGSGDYGEALDIASGPESTALKLQVALAQGNTLINYYLLTGGRNPMLFEPVGDGNDRVAFTGERHGFAAPIDPEGNLAPGHGWTARATRAVRDQAGLLRAARPEPAPVALAFVPDHYMTEYHYPRSARDTAFVAELDRFRGSGPREVMTRALVTGGFAPDAVNIADDGEALVRFGTDRVLALAPTPYLDGEIQQRLVDWVRSGGRLLLSGPLPQHDMIGRPDTTLVDALGLELGVRDESGLHQMTYAATPGRTPFVAPALVDGVPAWDAAEVMVGFAQPLVPEPGATVLGRLARSGEPCVVEVPLGAGTVIAVAADLPCLPQIWDVLLARLGAAPIVEASSDVRGVVVVPCATPDGTQVVHVVNVSPWRATVSPSRDGEPLLADALELPGRTGAWIVRGPGERFGEVAFIGGER